MLLQIVLCNLFNNLVSTARLTQIIHIYKCKSTGSLALITCAIILLGNLGRLFTVLVEAKNDYMFVISTVLAAVLNATILAQFFIYWPKKTENK